MNGNNLEDWLRTGKSEADSFASRCDLDACKQTILRKAVEEKSAARPLWTRAIRCGAAVAAGVLLCSAALLAVDSFRADRLEGPQNSMAQQPVQLDNSGKEYQVSFFPVNTAQEDQGIMGVLWAMNLEGESELLYTSLFESCDKLYPVSTITLPGTSSRYVLLTSGSSRGYIHYRLIGDVAGAVTTLWSQDYVPEGTLGVQDNVLIEQRAYDNARRQVTYILPYRMLSTDAVSLPVEQLNLQVGDQLIFVGDGETPALKIGTQNGILQQTGADEYLFGSEDAVAFVAAGTGDDLLSLSGAQDHELGHLALHVLKE